MDATRAKALMDDILAQSDQMGLTKDCAFESTDSPAEKLMKLDNYLCDLLDVQTINGLQNTARTYAHIALAILCFSLMLLWVLLPHLFTVKNKSQIIMSIAGILSMVITLFLASEVHDVIIRIAGVFGTLALILTVLQLYKDRYIMLFFLGIICLVLFLTNYYIYETELLLYTLPLIQKITFIFCISWFILLNRALIKKLFWKH